MWGGLAQAMDVLKDSRRALQHGDARDASSTCAWDAPFRAGSAGR